MGRKASLRRGKPTRNPKRTILVFTEGEVTEPAYVNALKQLEHVRRSTSIRIDVARDHAVPFPLVESALRAARDDEVDEVWCLLDVEAPQSHPKLREARAKAAAHEKVHLAFSNPCFELWIVLHDEHLGGWITTDDAEKAAQRIDGVTGKQVAADKLVPRRDQAADRARRLRRQHEQVGTSFPRDNPSTQVDLFVEAVERSAAGGADAASAVLLNM